MEPYEMKHLIIDDDFNGEETVTAEFTFHNKNYSISFNKADLEIINTWVLEEHSSLPANLSAELIDSIRKDVEKRI